MSLTANCLTLRPQRQMATKCLFYCPPLPLVCPDHISHEHCRDDIAWSSLSLFQSIKPPQALSLSDQNKYYEYSDLCSSYLNLLHTVCVCVNLFCFCMCVQYICAHTVNVCVYFCVASECHIATLCADTAPRATGCTWCVRAVHQLLMLECQMHTHTYSYHMHATAYLFIPFLTHVHMHT